MQKHEVGHGNIERSRCTFESLIESTISFLTLQAEAGVDALMLFDSWASAVPAAQRQWLLIEPARKIVSGLREKGYKQPVIDSKRYWRRVVPYVEQSTVHAVELDHGVDPGGLIVVYQKIFLSR